MTHDEELKWQQLKTFGALSAVDSLETFRHRFEVNYGRALSKLQGPGCFAPDADLVREVHAGMFVGIFPSAGGFRDNSRPTIAQEGHELCAASQVADRLNKLAEPLKFLTFETDPAAQVTKIANYHADFMELEPFKEIPNSKFVNRAVGLAILESQLEHCFKAKHLKREVDAEKLRDAVHYHVEHAAPARLEQLVKEMGGQQAKSISLGGSGQEIERER